MNRFDIIYILISVSIVSVGYLILWTSPAQPGSWKTAGKIRTAAFHFSLWFIAILLLAMFSFGLDAFLLRSPFYYYSIMALCAAIFGSIALVEIIGVVIKGSEFWSNKKRVFLILAVTLLQFVFSTTIAWLVKFKMR